MCHRPLKLRTDGGYARVHELGSIDFCNVTDYCGLEPIRSKLRTLDLAGVFPGTVWTCPPKNFSKRGRGQGKVTHNFLENKC